MCWPTQLTGGSWKVYGEKEYSISAVNVNVIYIFMGRMPSYMLCIALWIDDELTNVCSSTFMATNCT